MNLAVAGADVISKALYLQETLQKITEDVCENQQCLCNQTINYTIYSHMFLKDTTENRQSLAELEGKVVIFKGQVIRTEAPTKNQRHSCLGNVRVALPNPDVQFDERDGCLFQHLWLRDHESGSDYKARIGDKVEGYAVVQLYEHKDGTKAYGLKFEKKELAGDTEIMDQIEEITSELARSNIPVPLKQQMIDAFCQKIMNLVYRDKVLYFDITQKTLLKLLYKKRCILYAEAKAYELNREQRRAQSKMQKSKPFIRLQQRQRQLATGF